MRPKPAVLLFVLALIVPSTALAAWSRVPMLVFASSSGDQISAGLCPDGVGGAIVVWTNQDFGAPSTALAQRISASGTLLWGSGVPVVDRSQGTSVVGVVSDGQGGAIVLVKGTAIFVQRLAPDGTRLWPAAGVTVSDGNEASIAPDGHHGAIVSFSKRTLDPENPLQATDDIYAQRFDDSGTPLWAANGVPVNSQYTNPRSKPQICADGSGGAVVSWLDLIDIYPRFTISLQKINASGVAQWGPSGVLTGGLLGQFRNYHLATDDGGGALVSWGAPRETPYLGASVYAQRVDATGVPRWGSSGIAPTSQPFIQDYFTTIVSDGSGGGIIVWAEDRTGVPLVDDSGYNIFAQRLHATGARLWGEMGIPVSSAGSQFGPKIMSDGEGGTIVNWIDRRNGVLMPYVQRLVAEGKPQWKGGGAQVAGTPLSFSASMISDDDGGAILAWSAGSPTEVFAQRIGRNGKWGGGPQGPRGSTAASALPATIVTASHLALRVDLPSAGPLKLGLHDVTGRRVRAWREEFREAGVQDLRFDLRDDSGQSLRSGLYFLDLTHEGGRMTRRIVVQR